MAMSADFEPHIDDIIYPTGGQYTDFLVAVRPGDFSASSIARAIEDCDLHLLNMNVTSVRTSAGDIVVALRTDACVGDNVARSLERYGYDVIASSGSLSSIDDDEAERRAAELLRLLDI